MGRGMSEIESIRRMWPAIQALHAYAQRTDNIKLGTPLHEIVRAVLLVMREPTEGQYEALCATDKLWRELDSATVWRTYIDHLLSDES